MPILKKSNSAASSLLKKLSTLSSLELSIGARSSRLSRAQVNEVYQELTTFYPDIRFIPTWVTTTGDHDLKTSLRTLDKTDFFTKEIDELQLQGEFRIALHSAKDLPEPLREGLQIVAITRGVDPSDSLVFNHELPTGALIGVSSLRREENLLKWRPDLQFTDIRGTIDHRLALLDEGKVDGVVIAEAALIRLGITHRKRMRIEGETAPLQGKLAVIAQKRDNEMEQLFCCLDTQ
jgi:hydroxymethylbilane synthase